MENTSIIKKNASELISDEVQELISNRPNWIIRNGNTLLFVMIALFLSFTWLIKYPDAIKGSMKLNAVNPPKLLLSKSCGNLEKLLVINEQAVKQGQPLAFLQRARLCSQLLQLQSWINNIEPFIKRDSLGILIAMPLPIFNELGEMQGAYREFRNSFKQALQAGVNGFYQQRRQALEQFNSAVLNFKLKLEAWIQRYVVIAPEDGIVLLTSFQQEHRSISAGQELFYIQPKKSRYFGELWVSQTGLRKIKIGQEVLVRVESYPTSEFGHLIGTVSSISTIPNAADSFLIKVDLPLGLQTNYNIAIPFRNDLAAQGEVITGNRRLIDKFVGEFGNGRR